MKAAFNRTSLIIIAAGRLAFAQTSTDITDPFIATIAAMKHSVTTLVCLDNATGDAKILEQKGSAFFVSADGAFLTAAHVIEAMSDRRTCPIAAFYLPLGAWQPGAVHESLVWFPFTIDGCSIDRQIDVAKCQSASGLSDQGIRSKFRIVPARFEYAPQPDGTAVAFTGFPLNIRDPMTSRAAVATRRRVLIEDGFVDEIVLDHVAWPGGSGSPVYLADGRVIGIMLARGIDQGTGIAVVRPAESLRAMLAGGEARETAP